MLFEGSKIKDQVRSRRTGALKVVDQEAAFVDSCTQVDDSIN